jgi:hypothetical protein
MAIINKGKSFANGEQLTADKLNQVIDNATFTTSAVDNVSTQLSSGAIIVKDGGVTTAKLNNGAVTKAKIENVANMKVLGNTSGSAAAPQEVSILDEDDMSSDSATALSTQQSIKAYVDNFPGIKAHCVWDGTLTGTNAPTSGSGVTSVTRNATGNWTINLSVTAPSAFFTVLVSADPTSTGSFNYSTGGFSSSTTSASVSRERSDGAAHDNGQMSFAAIW